MNTVRNTKNQMRSEYLEKRAGISAETRRAWDEKICKVFLSLASYRFSDVVLAYLPSGGEIDIRPVLFYALAKGKRVALPRSAEGEAMDFYFITREELEKVEDLDADAPRLPAPDACRYCPDGSPAFMIIPALAYDTAGYRLGYGRGYYDRYINSFVGTRAGLCYTSFLSGTPLPRGRHDIAADFIVTEKGVRFVETK